MDVKFNGKALRAAPKQSHYTQEAFAELVGICSRYVGALERGERKNPSVRMLTRLCHVLAVPHEALMSVPEES